MHFRATAWKRSETIGPASTAFVLMISGAFAFIGRMTAFTTSKLSITTNDGRREHMSIKRPEGGWNITRPPVHPGEMLREEFMKPLEISINGLALELHVPVTRVSQIVNERRGITADTALRLARHFGTSADFWMNIQKEYELALTRRKSLKTIERQVRRRMIAA